MTYFLELMLKLDASYVQLAVNNVSSSGQRQPTSSMTVTTTTTKRVTLKFDLWASQLVQAEELKRLQGSAVFPHTAAPH